MWELEQSCCFNLRKLMAAKMAVLSTVDGVFLIFLMAAVEAWELDLRRLSSPCFCRFRCRALSISGAVSSAETPLQRVCYSPAGVFMAGGILMLRQYLPELHPFTVSAGMAAGIRNGMGFVLPCL